MKKNIKTLIEYLEIYKRDFSNKLIYGINAPKHLERIWINPLEIRHLITREEILNVTGLSRKYASGTVIDWEKIRNFIPLYEEYRIQYCIKHWKQNITWEDLGVFEFMSKTNKYGGQSMNDIIKRFEMLDNAFQKIKEDKYLKSRQELVPGTFREKDGILIHIGPNGEPFFGGIGFHRLAMSIVLELEKIPACVGVVDKNSIQLLRKLRNKG